jgi:hypothetical protein
MVDLLEEQRQKFVQNYGRERSRGLHTLWRGA